MDDRERRRYDMFARVKQFGAENTVDFPPESIGATQFAEVADVIDLLDQLSGDQVAGFGDARFEGVRNFV